MARTESAAPIYHPSGLIQRVQALRQRSFSRLKPVAKAVAPAPVLRWIQRQRKAEFTPPVGKVAFGDFRRVTPISRTYGYDRGRPLDRYYIEAFLEEHAALIRGRVLEIGDNTYTRAFGGARVTHSDVLHACDPEAATIVGDLADLSHVPDDAFDCMIITQTLHLVYEIRAAVANIHRVLRPGGTLLATFPGLSQISDATWRDTWHWGFTSCSASRLLTEIFPNPLVEVTARGNVLVAAAFLFGLSDSELTKAELDFDDPDYQMLITAKATKPRPDERYQMMDRWDYSGRDQFPYDAQDSYEKGMAFLDGHGTIEDWGCGTAYARRFVHQSPYVGLDGSQSEFATKFVDLQTYRSDADCIFMRHVLEHNYGWRLVLENAVRSFRKRMVLILFTPFSDQQRKIGDNEGIPNLSLRREDVVAFFNGLSFTEESLRTATEYGHEHIFYIERP